MLDLLQRLESAAPERGLYLHEDYRSAPTFIPYTEFPARVAACAEHLRARGVQRGTRVILPFETDERVLFSLFGLMEVGALPLSVKPHLPTTGRQGYRDFLERISQRYGASRILDVPSLKGLELPLERVPLPPAGARVEGARLRTASEDELAFVQFSSGSTSFPKGVPITQRNLVANLGMIVHHDGMTPEDRVASWLPLFHDMGLIGLMTCFYAGSDAYLTQPMSFLMDPMGWLESLSERRITSSVIPNFAIDYSLKTLNELEPEELAHLDLSALRTVHLASEPINIPNLKRFTEQLAPQGLRRSAFKPCYGMAEAVLMVTCMGREEDWRVVTGPSGQPAISVGRPLREFDVRLRAENGRLCDERELGEIELRGGSLAPEYFEDERPLRGEEGFYATGDLGFVQDGELFITGRIGDRIKINGQSYFSADFEQAIERLPFIRTGRTAVFQDQGRVVVLAEARHPAVLARRAHSQRQVCAAILEAVGVTVSQEDVLFIRYGQLPKTSSGKLQRRAIAEAHARGHIRLATPLGLHADLLKLRARRLVHGSLRVLSQGLGRGREAAHARPARG
ncbi:AMP-binding protein [Hyalangium rubrum]|uniref:AMP-binding protein n=1 Tax=Hyalangium rubrum TaxID=3103134 RepID=A0ABU5H1B3_9BACT|nr:AMP-binding protein [Hyalangium sp. s54d21]MDY7227240.1 AMP-binding protein [Hyalangium sp. s54d21]